MGLCDKVICIKVEHTTTDNSTASQCENTSIPSRSKSYLRLKWASMFYTPVQLLG